MEIKVLGSVSPYPKGSNNCPGYLVTDKNAKILLDCGNGVSSLLDMQQDLEGLNIIISHLHKDHYGDLGAIAYASFVYHNLGLLNDKVKVYIPNDKSLEDYKYLMNFGTEKYIDFYIYDGKSDISINDVNISFYQTQHPIKTYAIKIIKGKSKISYSADTGYEENIASFFKDSDILICESSFLKSQKNNNLNHLSAEEAAMIAKKSNTKKLILTHFWPEIDKNEYLYEAKEVFEKVEAAEEGKKYILQK